MYAPAPATPLIEPFAHHSARVSEELFESGHYQAVIHFSGNTALYSAQLYTFSSDLDEALIDRTNFAPIPPTVGASFADMSSQWLIDKAFKERDIVFGQLAELGEYYTHISPQHIFKGTLKAAYELWWRLKPESLTSHLTYNQSLHIRASLPNGAVHLSVVFEPGVDPTAPMPDADGDDANAVASLYDRHGVLVDGTTGPLPQVLAYLSTFAQRSAG